MPTLFVKAKGGALHEVEVGGPSVPWDAEWLANPNLPKPDHTGAWRAVGEGTVTNVDAPVARAVLAQLAKAPSWVRLRPKSLSRTVAMPPLAKGVAPPHSVSLKHGSTTSIVYWVEERTPPPAYQPGAGAAPIVRQQRTASPPPRATTYPPSLPQRPTSHGLPAGLGARAAALVQPPARETARATSPRATSPSLPSPTPEAAGGAHVTAITRAMLARTAWPKKVALYARAAEAPAAAAAEASAGGVEGKTLFDAFFRNVALSEVKKRGAADDDGAGAAKGSRGERGILLLPDKLSEDYRKRGLYRQHLVKEAADAKLTPEQIEEKMRLYRQLYDLRKNEYAEERQRLGIVDPAPGGKGKGGKGGKRRPADGSKGGGKAKKARWGK